MANWYGKQRAGWYTYNQDEMESVVAKLREHCTGYGNRMRTDDFYPLCAPVSPRAVQAILSDRDGVDFLLCRYPAIFICTEATEGDQTTQRLRATARTEMERATRREQFAQSLPRAQEQLI